MSIAQKALSHPWISQLPGSMVSDILTQGANCNQFSSENNISCTTEIGSSAIQFCGNKQQELHQASNANNTNFSLSDIPSYRPINSSTVSKSSQQIPISNGDLDDNFIFYTLEATGLTKCTVDASSTMLSNPECIGFEEPNQQQYSGFSISLPHDMQPNMATDTEEQGWRKNPCPVQLNQYETGRTIGFPFSLPPNDAWNKATATVAWDSLPCPSELSTSYSTNKCYT